MNLRAEIYESWVWFFDVFYLYTLYATDNPNSKAYFISFLSTEYNNNISYLISKIDLN